PRGLLAAAGGADTNRRPHSAGRETMDTTQPATSFEITVPVTVVVRVAVEDLNACDPALSKEENLLGHGADLVESERSPTAEADRVAIDRGRVEGTEDRPSHRPYGLPTVVKTYPSVTVTNEKVSYAWGMVWADAARIVERAAIDGEREGV